MISDISDYLEDQGIGTVGQDIFDNYLPDTGETPALAVIDTGGMEPDIDLPHKEKTFQVFIRADTYANADTKLQTVRTALHQLMNQTLGSTYFYFIYAMQEGGPITISQDSSGRGLVEMSINFRTRTR